MKKLLIVLSLLTLLSCSKSSSNANNSTGKSNTELLVNKKWKLIFENGKLANGTITSDDYPSLPNYVQDDYSYFKSDLTWASHDNTIKTPGNSSDTLDYGTWTLTNGDQYLQMISTMPLPPGYSTEYFPSKILELTDKSLKLESYDYADTITIWTNYTVIQ
jgi:hypothetical protein